MFDLFGTDRLTAWREFRTSLETSATPLKDVAEFWARAPFVSSYIDPSSPSDWPDPWHLVLDNRYDDLAIALGMLYTLKLTQRFMTSEYEIHMSMPDKNKEVQHILIVDHADVLNFEYNSVVNVQNLKDVKTTLIWSKNISL